MAKTAGALARTTIERRELAARALDDGRNKRMPLAREVLAELMVIAQAEFAFYHRKSRARNRRELAGQWYDRTAFVAKALAPFQSPTMKAIVVAPPAELAHLEHAKPNDGPDGARQVQEITLRVFEGGRLALPVPPKQLDKPVKS